ncbi:hypothetical protein BC835DRAFT_762069 [Cytidiella melzeri]|nr:hypothetical protein BC835DRAFT_762069 [Cytidiella melzeri]
MPEPRPLHEYSRNRHPKHDPSVRLRLACRSVIIVRHLYSIVDGPPGAQPFHPVRSKLLQIIRVGVRNTAPTHFHGPGTPCSLPQQY